jgi:DNA-binding XRE family transcriptional regulator
MMLKELPQSYSSLPASVKPAILALSILIDRLGTLSKEDRDDLFELLSEWAKVDDPEERARILEAMEEILAGPPSVEAKAMPLTEVKPMPPRLKNWTEFISKGIRNAREAAGLTQQQLAEKAGLRQSHISRLENGEHSPNHITLEKIAHALGKSIGDLDPGSD